MKYEYKVIRYAFDEKLRYKCAHAEAVEDVGKRINELGGQGWRLVEARNECYRLEYALMERIVTTFGCTTCKEEQPKEQ